MVLRCVSGVVKPLGYEDVECTSTIGSNGSSTFQWLVGTWRSWPLNGNQMEMMKAHDKDSDNRYSIILSSCSEV